jgi:tight adherence protein C
MDESHRQQHSMNAAVMTAAAGSALVGMLLAYRFRPLGARLIFEPQSAQRVKHPRFLSRVRAKTIRQRAIAAQLPDLIDLVVATVRAGYTPSQAIQQLIPVASDVFVPALREMARRISVGELFAEAANELPKQLGPGALALADSLAIADRYGLPLGPILDRLADEAKAQRRRNAEASARKLPVRLAFPLVCCTLPSFALLSIVPLLAGTISSLRGLTR